jgi:hypothetical protein
MIASRRLTRPARVFTRPGAVLRLSMHGTRR